MHRNNQVPEYDCGLAKDSAMRAENQPQATHTAAIIEFQGLKNGHRLLRSIGACPG